MSALRATRRTIYPINPLAASRYRSRHQVSGAKSDAADAVLLANILRTDAAARRPLPDDTELAQAIRVLARAQQDAVWARQQIGNLRTPAAPPETGTTKPNGTCSTSSSASSTTAISFAV